MAGALVAGALAQPLATAPPSQHRMARWSPTGAGPLATGKRLRQPCGGSVGAPGRRCSHLQLGVAARPLSGAELGTSTLQPGVDLPTRWAAPLHAAGSAARGDESDAAAGAAPSSSAGAPSSSSSSSSSSSLNGSAPTAAEQRDSASSSELLRAVLKRRADRLQRQQEAAAAPYQSGFSPAAQQQAATQQPAEPSHVHPQAQAAQHQAAQQAPAAQQAAPQRYKPHWATGGGASGAPAAQPATGPPPPPPPTALVPAPEQRVVRTGGMGAAVRDDAVAQRKLATVRFWLKFRAEWGQRLKVVGTHQELGAWTLAAAPELKWSEGDQWHTTVQLPAGGVVEYKYVLLDHSGQHPVAWQQGNNSVLALRPGDELVEVFDNWNAEPGAKLVADGGRPVTRETRLLSWASEMEAQLASQKQDLRRSRMELAAAQEEAREARAEAQRFKAQLMALEADKAEAAGHLQHARALNEALQAQLADTTASFQEALRTAADILSQIDDVTADVPDVVASSSSGSTATAPPALPPPAPRAAGAGERERDAAAALAAADREVAAALAQAERAAAQAASKVAPFTAAAASSEEEGDDEEGSADDEEGVEDDEAPAGSLQRGEASAAGFQPSFAAGSKRRRGKGTKAKARGGRK